MNRCGPWGSDLNRAPRIGGIRRYHRDVSPEIRSLQEGRIRPGSVAPLLSRRAKALALSAQYDDSDDDDYNHYYDFNVSDKNYDYGYLDDDYDDDEYDESQSLRRYRQFYVLPHQSRRYDDHECDDEEENEEVPEEEVAGPSSTSQPPVFPRNVFFTRSLPKLPQRKPASASTARTGAKATAKPKKATTGTTRTGRKKNTKPKTTTTAPRSGPMTRSRGTPLEDGADEE